MKDFIQLERKWKCLQTISFFLVCFISTAAGSIHLNIPFNFTALCNNCFCIQGKVCTEGSATSIDVVEETRQLFIWLHALLFCATVLSVSSETAEPANINPSLPRPISIRQAGCLAGCVTELNSAHLLGTLCCQTQNYCIRAAAWRPGCSNQRAAGLCWWEKEVVSAVVKCFVQRCFQPSLLRLEFGLWCDMMYGLFTEVSSQSCSASSCLSAALLLLLLYSSSFSASGEADVLSTLLDFHRSNKWIIFTFHYCVLKCAMVEELQS